MRKAIVTGGAGFIGSTMTDRLINEGYHVLVIDNLSTGKAENINDIFSKTGVMAGNKNLLNVLNIPTDASIG